MRLGTADSAQQAAKGCCFRPGSGRDVLAGEQTTAADEQRKRSPRLLRLTKGVVSGSSLDGPLTCELDEEGGPADARLGLRGCGGILCLLELALHRLSSDIQGTLPAPSGHCRVSWSARLGRAARSASSAGDSSAPDITDPGITTASLEAAARGSERTGSRRAVEATPDRKRLNVRGSL
jgi:hypothetical protein